MQIVLDLHEMLNQDDSSCILSHNFKFYFLGKIRQKKKIKMSSAEILTQHAKR